MKGVEGWQDKRARVKWAERDGARHIKSPEPITKLDLSHID